MRIVLLGNVCIDHNISEHSTYTNWGSPLMYMANYLYKYHNIRPVLIAPAGDDFNQYIDGFKLITGKNTARTFINKNYTHHKHRKQQWENYDIMPVNIDQTVIDQLVLADILVIAPLLPNLSSNYIKEVMTYVKKDCLKVLLPQGFFRKANQKGDVLKRQFLEANRINKYFDLVIFSNEDTSEAFTKARKWTKKNSSKIIVTEGEKGASWIDSTGILHHISTEKVKESDIIDSVGCGDVFGAATMIDYYKTNNLDHALDAGNKAAGKKLFQIGI